MSPQRRGYFAVICAATLWGVAGTAAKFLFQTTAVPPFLLVQVRTGLSFVVLLLSLGICAPKLLRIPRGQSIYLTVWGIVGLGMVQFTYLLTIAETNVATAIFLQYLAPILTALYGWMRGIEQWSRPLVVALALAMLGSSLLIFGGGARLLVSPLGLVTGLCSAGFMAFYTIYGQRGLSAFSHWTLLCYGLGTGSLFWLLTDILLALVGRAPNVAPLAGGFGLWGFFGYLALFATVVPFGIYLWGLRSLTPTQATITGMLEPVVGGISAFLLLHERLLPMQTVGGLFIVTAVFALQAGRTSSTAKP